MAESAHETLALVGNADGLPDAFYEALARLLLDIYQTVRTARDAEEAA